MNIFWGDLTDISAIKRNAVEAVALPLVLIDACRYAQGHYAVSRKTAERIVASGSRGLTSSVAVLAEISFRSPRKMYIFIIQKRICRIKVSLKHDRCYPKKLIF